MWVSVITTILPYLLNKDWGKGNGIGTNVHNHRTNDGDNTFGEEMMESVLVFIIFVIVILTALRVRY